MSDTKFQKPHKGMAWNTIPDGDYWFSPVFPPLNEVKEFHARTTPVFCTIYVLGDKRMISYYGEDEYFDHRWKDYVFVHCEVPRLEDVDVSAGLAALRALA